MPTPRKYFELYAELHALDVRECWYVAAERFNVPIRRLSARLNHRMGAGRYRALAVPGGVLFVRIL